MHKPSFEKLASKVIAANTSEPLTVDESLLRRLRYIRSKQQEYFVCLSLSSSGQVIRRRTVTIGLLDMALVHPREVFAGPLKDRAATILVAHNHPSGSPQPSDADIKTTEQLAAAGMLLGIPLRDHVIVTKWEHYSFREASML